VVCIFKKIFRRESWPAFHSAVFLTWSWIFVQWYGVELTQENQWQLWIAPGLAHGFVVTSEIAHFHYKCTELYHPEDEGSICWNDPELNIAWPIAAPMLSAKDMIAPSFAELKRMLFS